MSSHCLFFVWLKEDPYFIISISVLLKFVKVFFFFGGGSDELRSPSSSLIIIIIFLGSKRNTTLYVLCLPELLVSMF